MESPIITIKRKLNIKKKKVLVESSAEPTRRVELSTQERKWLYLPEVSIQERLWHNAMCESIITIKHVSTGRYRVVDTKEKVMVKIDGVMKYMKATTFDIFYRDMKASYRDEIPYHDRMSCFNKHYFNIFMMKVVRNGTDKKGDPRTTNKGCKIRRITKTENGCLISVPSTHHKNDLLQYMMNNGLPYSIAEKKMTSYEERVNWIIKGKWDEVGSEHYASLITLHTKEKNQVKPKKTTKKKD